MKNLFSEKENQEINKRIRKAEINMAIKAVEYCVGIVSKEIPDSMDDIIEKMRDFKV